MALQSFLDVLGWLYRKSPCLERVNPTYQPILLDKLRVAGVMDFDMTDAENRVLTLAIVLCWYRAHRRLGGEVLWPTSGMPEKDILKELAVMAKAGVTIRRHPKLGLSDMVGHPKAKAIIAKMEAAQ
jgi:hypothetical protein